MAAVNLCWRGPDEERITTPRLRDTTAAEWYEERRPQSLAAGAREPSARASGICVEKTSPALQGLVQTHVSPSVRRRVTPRVVVHASTNSLVASGPAGQ